MLPTKALIRARGAVLTSAEWTGLYVGGSSRGRLRNHQHPSVKHKPPAINKAAGQSMIADGLPRVDRKVGNVRYDDTISLK